MEGKKGKWRIREGKGLTDAMVITNSRPPGYSMIG